MQKEALQEQQLLQSGQATVHREQHPLLIEATAQKSSNDS
jgi:hypothetical protein